MKKLKVILLILFIVSFAISIYNILQIKKELSESDQMKEELIKLVEIPEEPEVEETFSVDFSELEKINSDVVGWIVIEGTQVNYPIVQGKDNSYYLNHSFDKSWSSLGSIFMDYRSTNDFSDYNTFIYGHHTKNGSMFGELYKYMDATFYKEHPFFYLYSPEGIYKVEIISAYLDSAESDSYVQKFGSIEDYKRYINLIVKKSNYITDTIFDSSTDKIITLYSCSHESNRRKEDRYFIHGKIIKI
ncbi:MAG: class B sortase [Firmicutes bacterium]|nr:class B sortase [Bacillota bacterium]